MTELTTFMFDSVLAAKLHEPGVNRVYIECLKSSLKPEMFSTFGYSLAESSFHDIVRLRALNLFFETSAGRRVIESGLNQVKDDELREEAGLPTRVLPDPQYSDAEQEQIVAWYHSAAYEDFNRFNDYAKKTLPSNPKATAVLRLVAASCYGKSNKR